MSTRARLTTSLAVLTLLAAACLPGGQDAAVEEGAAEPTTAEEGRGGNGRAGGRR